MRGLGRRCTLHFKYDGNVTLYVRVFGEDGHRIGCCPETTTVTRCLALATVETRVRMVLPSVLAAARPATAILPPATAPAAAATTSRRARFEGGSGSSRCRAPVKRKEGSG